MLESGKRKPGASTVSGKISKRGRVGNLVEGSSNLTLGQSLDTRFRIPVQTGSA